MNQPDRIARFAQAFAHIFQTHELGSETGPIQELTLDEAYAVQSGFAAARSRLSGKVIGWKVGCTSPAIQQQFGLTQPISGRLFEREFHVNHAELQASHYVDCAIEPELVFRLGADLHAGATDEQLIQSITSVAAGIELHNFRFWYGRPSSQELIASNGIHAGLVCGPEQPFAAGFDLNAEPVSVLVNGKVRASGVCSEIMGGPLQSMRWLLNHVTAQGEHLQAGQLIIPGSAVELVRVARGDEMEARFGNLQSCFARLV